MDPTPFLPDGWGGNDVVLICPCRNRTEWDGGLPCEHENPLKAKGMI
jgi:hypothetical protein